MFVHMSGMPKGGNGFVVANRVGQGIGIDENAPEDSAVAQENGEPRGVELRKLPHDSAAPVLRSAIAIPMRLHAPCWSGRAEPRHGSRAWQSLGCGRSWPVLVLPGPGGPRILRFGLSKRL